MQSYRTLLFAIAPLFFFSTAQALELNLQVERFKLDNGLTVLLHEDHSIPMVSFHTWYRVGSRDEGPGVTGAAHMLEHMMFKGLRNTRVKNLISCCTKMESPTTPLQPATIQVFTKTFRAQNLN